jgi:hypothetical protein
MSGEGIEGRSRHAVGAAGSMFAGSSPPGAPRVKVQRLNVLLLRDAHVWVKL